MRYLVITPEYGEVVPLLDDGTGPTEYGRDVVEVNADNKRQAIILGVAAMIMDRHYKWCREARAFDECPYAGVYAEEY